MERPFPLLCSLLPRVLGDRSRLTGVAQESADGTFRHSQCSVEECLAAREMVLLIEAVTSAFKMSVWGGHPRGRQRVLYVSVLFFHCVCQDNWPSSFWRAPVAALSIPAGLQAHAATPSFYVGEEFSYLYGKHFPYEAIS